MSRGRQAEFRTEDTRKTIIEALRAVIGRLHYPLEVMLTCVRWYVAYPLGPRHIEEIMAERDVFVDHATIHRWALKIVPALVKVFRSSTRLVGKSWRMDETSIKVRGQWKYLYRAVDRDGDTVDFLLTAHRDLAAARRFLECAIDRHGKPEKITIDKSGANTAAIDSYNVEHEAGIEMRQCKYLNNIVEQDHRAIKRVVRPMLGFKSARCAIILLASIETMHVIRKGQLDSTKGHRVRSEPVLLSIVLNRWQSNGFVRPDQHIATEPSSTSWTLPTRI